MRHEHRVTLNTSILYVRMAITLLISLYTTKITLSALGIEDFGIFNLVGGAVAMLTFMSSGMVAASQRYMSIAQGSRDIIRQQSVFNVSLWLHLMVAVFIVVAMEIAGYFLFEKVFVIEIQRIYVAKLIYQIAIINAFFSVISVSYEAVISARENMMLPSILGVIEAILKLGIAFYIQSTSKDVLIMYSLLMTLLSICLLGIRTAYCHIYYLECKLIFVNYFKNKLFKEMLYFSGWSFLGSSASLITNYGQGILLNMFFGVKINAAQGLVTQIGGQLSVLTGAMMQALNPIIGKSEGSGNRELMRKASTMGSKVGFFLLMLIYVPVMIEMPYLFKLWLNEVPKYTIIFCTLLLLRKLIEQLFLTLSSSIIAVGNIKKYQLVTSLITILPLPISYLLFLNNLPPYFLYITFLAYSIALSVVILFFACKYCGFILKNYLVDVVGRCILAFIATFLVSILPLFFIDQGIERLILVILISIISFCVSVWYVGFCSRERYLIINLFYSVIYNSNIFSKKVMKKSE